MLATSTDGVGTKIAIAQALDRHDTIGIDLVAMVVDDLVVVGAEPLFLTDYIATGKVVPEKIAAIVAGIAEGCVQAGCALVGGETAEHPGLMRPDEYDVSGTGIGVVDADARARAGAGRGRRRADRDGAPPACTPTATRWSGTCCSSGPASTWPRTPPSSAAHAGRGAARRRPGSTPRTAWRWSAQCDVHAFCHVTGGGLAGNLARVLPAHLRRRRRPRRPGRRRRSST